VSVPFGAVRAPHRDGAGTQGPELQIYLYDRIHRKEIKKEINIKTRMGYPIRYCRKRGKEGGNLCPARGSLAQRLKPVMASTPARSRTDSPSCNTPDFVRQHVTSGGAEGAEAAPSPPGTPEPFRGEEAAGGGDFTFEDEIDQFPEEIAIEDSLALVLSSQLDEVLKSADHIQTGILNIEQAQMGTEGLHEGARLRSTQCIALDCTDSMRTKSGTLHP